MPIGVWSTSSTRATCSTPRRSAAAEPAARPCAAACRRRVCARRLAYSTSRASVDLPEPDTPVTTVSRPSGTRAFTLAQVVQFARARSSSAASPRRTGAPRRQADAAAGSRRNRPVTDSGAAIRSSMRALAHHAPAARAGARARGRSRGRRGGSCPRRARRPPACCPWRRASSSVSSSTGCRAGAGRWSARRARSRRPAGSSRAARRAGCAAPRRRTASARRGRAQM